MFSSFFLFFWAIVPIGSSLQAKVGKEAQNVEEQRYEPITIIIHGTRFIPLTAQGDSPVHRMLSRHLGTPNGLKHISELKKHSAFVELAHVLHKADPDQFSVNGFYFFGWSGKLRSNVRAQAGKDFFAKIKALRADPRFARSPLTVITHSHGGNLVLAGAGSIQKEASYSIDRLILLACPIQDATEEYAYSSLFKRLYNLYSGADIAQIIDPQKYHASYKPSRKNKLSRKQKETSFFSRRELEPAAHIKQAKLRWHNRGLSHLDFIKPDLFKKLPEIIHFLDNPHLYRTIPRTDKGAYRIKIKK
jgi:hypothetical protein